MATARVLVVDDEKVIVTNLTDLLTFHGYQVSVAYSGVEALSKVTEERPDLIMLDVMMPPGMDGYAVCDELKSNPDTQDIPIVMLTVKKGKNDRIRGFQKGIDDYITKPYGKEALITSVKNILSSRQTETPGL